MKKYKLTKETKGIFGVTLHRIKALVSFGSIQKGEIGGWIEKEENLEQEGDAWVYDNARVYGDAMVYGDAWISGKIKLTIQLCSKYSFEYQWQVDLWIKKEMEYENEVKRRLEGKE